ncbi:FAD-dependent oxidoreductase, partial [Lysobacter sp. 2RAB21]
PVEKSLSRLGVELLLGAKARGAAPDAKSVLVETAEGEERQIAADAILVTVGRKPALSDLGLEELVLDMDGSYIRIGERCETSMRGVH